MRVVARLVCAVAIERRFAVDGAGWFLPTVLAGVRVHAVARHNRFLFSIWRSCICCAFVCTHICLMPRVCLFARLRVLASSRVVATAFAYLHQRMLLRFYAFAQLFSHASCLYAVPFILYAEGEGRAESFFAINSFPAVMFRFHAVALL